MLRSSLKIALLASLAVALQIGHAQAAPGPFSKGGFQANKGSGPSPEMREQLRKRLDQNGDGKLHPQELAAGRQAIQARQGKGAPGQPKPGNEKGLGLGNGPNREAILQRFDKNSDGKLDDQERAAARKAFEERKNNK